MKFSGIVVSLVVFLALSIGSSWSDSPTFDEGVHLAAGFCYLKSFAPAFDPVNPPFPNVLSAFPLLFFRLDPFFDSFAVPRLSPERVTGFLFWLSQKVLYQTAPGADRLLFPCRLPGIILGTLCALGVFAWSRRLYGNGAGLFSLALFIFSPEILAQSRLITNDLGNAIFSLLALYFFWLGLKNGRGADFVLQGIAAGAALATKYTAVILFPLFVLLTVVWFAGRGKGGQAAEARPTLGPSAAFLWLLAAFGIAVLTVALVYKLAYFPLYLRGFAETLAHYREARPAFLWGRYSRDGWWYYFVVTFLLKTPPAFLVMLILVFVFRRRLAAAPLRDELFLLLPALAFFLAASASRLNIGDRHILAVYPFLFIFVGKLAHCINRHSGKDRFRPDPGGDGPPPSGAGTSLPQSRRGRRSHRKCLCQCIQRCGRAVLGPIRSQAKSCLHGDAAPRRQIALRWVPLALLAWYMASSLSVYPHFLSYCSEIVGGAKNGYKYLSDSNIDWGQDLKRLAIYLKKNDMPPVYLAYFGEADPNYYGIKYQYLLSDGPMPYREFSPVPEKKCLAISVKCLQGVSFPDHDIFAWLKDYLPAGRIGYSIFLYDLTGKIDAYLHLAYIYVLTGCPGLAEKELGDVLALDPKNAEARRELQMLREANPN